MHEMQKSGERLVNVIISDDSSKKMFPKYILDVNVLTKLFSKFLPRNLEFRASFPRRVGESRQ